MERGKRTWNVVNARGTWQAAPLLHRFASALDGGVGRGETVWMPVDSQHVLYDEFLPKWIRARDVIAGEDRIKEQGVAYLPRLDSQSDDEYNAYLERASFYNATGRSVSGFSGLVFRREAIVKVPNARDSISQVFARFKEDADLLSTALSLYLKRVVDEVLEMGRAGTLVDWHDSEKRPFVSLYKAESIINWRMERRGERMVLSLIVLMESVEEFEGDDIFAGRSVPQIRVLRLDAAGELIVDLWRRKKEDDGKEVWHLIESRQPMRIGKRLGFIPFVFHGPTDDSVDPQKPPLDDMIAVNLSHFRMDADFKHGLHYTALPTAWVAGFDKDTELKIGSTAAWVSDNVQATAGYLEFTGQGLLTFEREKDRAERLMSILGSRLLETQKRVSESAQTLSLRQSGESSVVANIAGSVSKGLTKVLRWCYWWLSSVESYDDIPADVVSVELNKDFDSSTMTAQELVAVVQAWQAGIMSHDSALNLMRQGELLPPSRTNEEERDLIEQQAPPGAGKHEVMRAGRQPGAATGPGS